MPERASEPISGRSESPVSMLALPVHPVDRTGGRMR